MPVSVKYFTKFQMVLLRHRGEYLESLRLEIGKGEGI